MGAVGGYKGVMCNCAGARDGVDCCRSKRKTTELRLAGRLLPGSSGSLTIAYRQVMRRSNIDVIDGVALREEYGRADVDARRTRDI